MLHITLPNHFLEQEFLVSMEENTDGSVSAKKCLSGDGQIDIDSDEAIAKSAVEFAKKKRAKLGGALGGKKRPAVRSSKQPATANAPETDTISASEDFVAVTLDSQGNVKRVLVGDQEA